MRRQLIKKKFIAKIRKLPIMKIFSRMSTLPTPRSTPISSLPELPHVITADPLLKILIDSGASSSIIDLKIAFELFSKFIFPYDFEIKSVHKVTKVTHVLTYPILRELGDDTPITFLVAE